MKKGYSVLFSFMVAVAFLSGCSKNGLDSCPLCHELDIRPRLTPMNKDYRVGDTMVLSLTLPYIQTHPEHFRTVNLSGFNPAYFPLYFLYYEPDATKTYYNRKSGYTINQYTLLSGQDKGQINSFSDYDRYFLPDKKASAYELRIRIVLKQQGYFSFGSRYGRYRAPNSPECFSAAFLFDTTSNNNFIRPLVGHEGVNWPEDFFFRVLP